MTRTKTDNDDGFSFRFVFKKHVSAQWDSFGCVFGRESLPSFCFLNAPFPKLLFVRGRFQPRQLLHKLSGSELQLHNESSSNRSESSKVNRSHSSFHSCATTTSGCCCAGCACGGEARAAPCCCCPGGSPTASPTLASSFIYFIRHVTNLFSIFTFFSSIDFFSLFHALTSLLEIFLLFFSFVSCTQMFRISFTISAFDFRWRFSCAINSCVCHLNVYSLEFMPWIKSEIKFSFQHFAIYFFHLSGLVWLSFVYVFVVVGSRSRRRCRNFFVLNGLILNEQ